MCVWRGCGDGLREVRLLLGIRSLDRENNSSLVLGWMVPNPTLPKLRLEPQALPRLTQESGHAGPEVGRLNVIQLMRLWLEAALRKKKNLSTCFFVCLF